jgi:hypothetical protein
VNFGYPFINTLTFPRVQFCQKSSKRCVFCTSELEMFIATESFPTINTWPSVSFPQRNRFNKLGTLPFTTQPKRRLSLIWEFKKVQPPATKIDAGRTHIAFISFIDMYRGGKIWFNGNSIFERVFKFFIRFWPWNLCIVRKFVPLLISYLKAVSVILSVRRQMVDWWCIMVKKDVEKWAVAYFVLIVRY